MKNRSVMIRIICAVLALIMCLSLVFAVLPVGRAAELDDDDDFIDSQTDDDDDDWDDGWDDEDHDVDDPDNDDDWDDEKDPDENDDWDDEKDPDDEDKDIDDEHVHKFKLELNDSGNSISAVCQEKHCTLTKSKITMSLITANRTYDGQNATVTLDGKDAFVKETGASVGSISYTREGFGQVGTTSDSGSYSVAVNVELDGVTKTVKGSFTVAKRAVKISGLNVANKEYDGTTKAEPDVKKVKIDNLVSGDNVSVELKGAEFPSPDVGVYTVAVQSARLTGSDADNYTLSTTDKIVCEFVEITRRDISNAKVTLGPALFFNGKNQKQTVEKVELEDEQGNPLEITCSISGDTATAEGEYTLKINGTGNFGGSVSVKYRVLPDVKRIEGNQASIGSGKAALILEDNGLGVTLDSSLKDILSSLTTEQLQEIAGGSNVTWTLSVGRGAPVGDQKVSLQRAAGAYTLGDNGLYLTMTQSADGVQTRIGHAPFKLTMKVDVPEKLKKITQFRVICSSDDGIYTAEAMDGMRTSDGKQLTFTTDRFGDLVLAYSGKTSSGANWYFIIMGIVAVVMVVDIGIMIFLMIKKRKAEEMEQTVAADETMFMPDIPGYSAVSDFVDNLKAKFSRKKQPEAPKPAAKAPKAQEAPWKNSTYAPGKWDLQPEQKNEPENNDKALTDALSEDNLDLDKLMELLDGEKK